MVTSLWVQSSGATSIYPKRRFSPAIFSLSFLEICTPPHHSLYSSSNVRAMLPLFLIHVKKHFLLFINMFLFILFCCLFFLHWMFRILICHIFLPLFPTGEQHFWLLYTPVVLTATLIILQLQYISYCLSLYPLPSLEQLILIYHV